MRNILKNAILKKILIVLAIIVMVTNFIMPNYVYAFTGEKLVSSILYLLSYVGDAVISLLQDIMKGDGYIKSGGEYSIKYSPGMIFADKVPALKVNFITASETDNEEINFTHNPTDKREMYDLIVRASAYIRKAGRMNCVGIAGTIHSNKGSITSADSYWYTEQEGVSGLSIFWDTRRCILEARFK